MALAATARAELIADGGAGAAAAEFFRSAPFHSAEGVTHTVRVHSADRVASLAVIVRDIPATGFRDATSTYGYPGASIGGDGPPPTADEVDWSATGLVSLFVRERLAAEPLLARPTDESRVFVHDPAAPRAVRPRLAEQVRGLRRRGYTAEALCGPESAESERAAFQRIYTETMHATEASERYFFDRAYFDRALEFERSWLILARRGSGEPGAAALVAVSDGYLHYFLGGTSDAERRDSPFKLVASAMLDLADELGTPLNLGGGYRPGDGLERFKRGFANAEATFRTHRAVCDRAAYSKLSADGDEAGFFPAYRAP